MEGETMDQIEADSQTLWQLDPDKPMFHVMPRSGWLNDPNGPVYYKGRYHIFYQHIRGSSQWDWKMSWGHASSADLVRWEHEPIAVQPTPGGIDANGCWSGTVVLDEDGAAIMLYTGVRLRNNPECGALPPQSVDLGLDAIETQCAATCPIDDDRLRTWSKTHAIIPHPPESMGLTGFRDPYVFERAGGAAADQPSEWRLMLGSGVKGKGGTLLVYASPSLTQGWEYRGELCKGRPGEVPGLDLGEVWECPFLVNLAETGESASSSDAYALCVSPYPHHLKDRPTNPCLYWIGGYQKGGQFDMASAAGPYQLDLGDVLYAPNCFRDGAGRLLLFAWLQELRSGPGFDYAGCLSLPREVTLRGGRIHQQPAKELKGLRTGRSWLPGQSFAITPDTPLPLLEVPAHSLDLEFTLERGSASHAGLYLKGTARQEVGRNGDAVLLVDWSAGRLEVVRFSEALEPAGSSPRVDLDKVRTRVGGEIQLPADAPAAVRGRLLVDRSVVELFLSTGETLVTRHYRGTVEPGEQAEWLYFVACGGDATVRDVAAYEMDTIWPRSKDQPRTV